MNKNKVDFQIKAYLLLYRNFKKLHTFKIQKVVRKIKKDEKRKQELASENSDPQVIAKIQQEVERLEKQKSKLDRVTKDHLKMLTLHNLTTIYNFNLENYNTYFEKELPGYVAKIELFNNESEEDIQLIKWFEETIKDHKNYKETNEKLHFFSSQLEQIVEKNKVKRKTRLQNKKSKLKAKKEGGEEGDVENENDVEIEKEGDNENEEAKSDNNEGFEIEPMQGGANDSESGEDIVLDDEDFEEEDMAPQINPKISFQKPSRNNNNNKNRKDKNQNNRNDRQGRDKAYMRNEDSFQRREYNKERNKSKRRGEQFDIKKFEEKQEKDREREAKSREPLKREWKPSQDGRRGGRDSFEPDVRKKFQRSNGREERSDSRRDQGRNEFPKKENKFSFDALHPSWKARIEQKQSATIATFQGTKEKL